MLRYALSPLINARGEVVDVGDAEGDEGVGELVGNDLGLLDT
jgi:hypothetical protein